MGRTRQRGLSVILSLNFSRLTVGVFALEIDLPFPVVAEDLIVL
jgi:hypothetical protein